MSWPWIDSKGWWLDVKQTFKQHSKHLAFLLTEISKRTPGQSLDYIICSMTDFSVSGKRLLANYISRLELKDERKVKCIFNKIPWYPDI